MTFREEVAENVAEKNYLGKTEKSKVDKVAFR